MTSSSPLPLSAALVQLLRDADEQAHGAVGAREFLTVMADHYPHEWAQFQQKWKGQSLTGRPYEGRAVCEIGGVWMDEWLALAFDYATEVVGPAAGALEVEPPHVAYALAVARHRGGSADRGRAVLLAFGHAPLPELSGWLQSYLEKGGRLHERVVREPAPALGRLLNARMDKAWNAMFAALDRGDPRSIKVAAERALRVVKNLPDHHSVRSYRGRALQVRAEALVAMGDIPGAADCYEEALIQLRYDMQNRHEYAIALANFAADTALYLPGEKVIPLLEEATWLLPNQTSEDTQLRERAQLWLLGMDESAPLPTPDLLTQQVNSIVEEKAWANAAYLLGARLVKLPADQQAYRRLGRSLVASSIDIVRRSQPLGAVVAILSTLPFLLNERPEDVTSDEGDPSGPPPQMLEALSECLQRKEELGLQEQAWLQTIHAEVVKWLGQPSRALEIALTAVALHDAAACRQESTLLRQESGGHSAHARGLAIELAIKHGHAAIAAELIESARLATLPQSVVRATSAAGVPSLVSGSRVRLGRVRPVSVEGRSCLLDKYPSNSAEEVPTPLEAVIEAIGGPGAWWWCVFPGLSLRWYWAVRGPEGAFEAGWIDVAAMADGRLRAALDSLFTHLRPGATGSFEDNPLIADPKAEQTITQEVGEYLIPPPLRAALLAGSPAVEASGGEARPISLVVSGTPLAELPLALLGIGGPDQDVRLIECAHLTMAPPVQLLRLDDPHLRPGTTFPVELVVADARGEFQHARAHLPPSARKLVGSRPGEAPQEASESPTRAHLRRALHSIGSGADATVFYTGHVLGESEGDLGAAILLADGHLTAADVFNDTWPFPKRVLLAACASAGSSGAGRGEWLGLTAAILWSGARSVIATSWPVWDTEESARFDLQLTKILSSSHNIAHDLRVLQVEKLQKWRSATNIAEGFASSPVHWSAYQLIGRPR